MLDLDLDREAGRVQSFRIDRARVGDGSVADLVLN